VRRPTTGRKSGFTDFTIASGGTDVAESSSHLTQLACNVGDGVSTQRQANAAVVGVAGCGVVLAAACRASPIHSSPWIASFDNGWYPFLFFGHRRRPSDSAA